MPARQSVPSSKRRPMSVTPCGTRRGGGDLGGGVEGGAEGRGPGRGGGGGREFGQGMLRVGRPVGACFTDFDEAGAQSERGGAGVVADGEDFVARRRGGGRGRRGGVVGRVLVLRVSFSSRSEGTRSRSTSEKMRAISWQTLRRKRSV